MGFKEQLADDMDNVFLNTDEFGETISYTVYGGSAKDISAVVVRQASVQEAIRGKELAEEAILHISKDATLGIATPTTRDTVVFDGETWAVNRILKQDADMAKLHAVRSKPIEKSRDDYRFENR